MRGRHRLRHIDDPYVGGIERQLGERRAIGVEYELVLARTLDECAEQLARESPVASTVGEARRVDADPHAHTNAALRAQLAALSIRGSANRQVPSSRRRSRRPSTTR